MKIGLVCPYSIFRGGGVPEHLFTLQKGLKERGHQAIIITPRPSEYKGVAPEDTILLGTARPIRVAKTSAHVSVNLAIDKLDEILQSEKFDILHFHEPWVPILSHQIMQRSDAIHIATFHAAMSERRTSRTIERVITPYTNTIFKYIDVLTAVSQTATNYVSTLTPKNILIIPNGIDLNKYHLPKTVQSKSSKKVIFYVGRLEKRKGVNHLIEAFQLLTQNYHDFKLVIAGTGPDLNKLKNKVDKDNIRNVEFLGFIDDQTKLKYLQTCDIFCSPALYGESCGIVLLEAMACGAVTVAGNNSGYEGVMVNRGEISLVDPNDTKEFARRLHLLSYDTEIRALWKKWAAQHVKTYDYNIFVDQYLTVYQAEYDKKHKK